MTLLDQVLTELDYAVGELQRACVLMKITMKYLGPKDKQIFSRAIDCSQHRIAQGKATMLLADYTPIHYRESSETDIDD